MLIGGNPNVVLPRKKYLDCLTRSGQPTHFAVRLAELAFGDDVLRASTVTGGKRGTLQLDPNIMDAIQSMIDQAITLALNIHHFSHTYSSPAVIFKT